ncbi:protocadherin-11 X-linked, partial [Clonorchis sinensis]
MIKIILADVNDNAPVFELPNMEYHLFFKEDDPRGTARQLPTASDRDFCFNGQVEYSLLWTQVKDSKLFTLTWSNNSRLELALKEGLDRETEHQYRLYLLAHDSGPIPTRHTTTLPLLITVEDANDCRPTFIPKNQHSPSPPCLPVNAEAPKPLPLVVSVPEDLSPGSLVCRLHAVDGDVGENAKISYHFGPRVHPLSRRIFSLNSSTGELRTQYSLDREQTPLHRDHHRLVVIAKDGGKPSRSSSLLVLVRLLDTNDNYPRMHLVDYGSQPVYNQPGVLRQLTEQSAKLWSGSTPFAGDQWTSLPVNFDLIGIQEPEKVIASLVVDDLDLKENGTVSCRLDRQLVQAGEERLMMEKAVARLKPLMGKYGRILVEKRSNRWIHTSPMLQPPAVENERMAIWNDTQAKAYVIETSLRLIPSSISHLYLRIRCHDYGTPRLASERTLHLRLWAEEDIKPRFNELEILSDAITPHCGTGLVPKNGQKIQLQNDEGSSNFGDAAVLTVCLTLSYAVEPGTLLFRVNADSPKLSNPNYVIHYWIDNGNTSDTASYFAIAADKGIVSIRRSLPRLPSRQV